MNLVQSVRPLLSIFGFDDGQETAIGAPSATRPALPMWQPAPGDTNAIERVINRVKVDGNVTIYEQEVIYIQQPAPEPQPQEPYPIVTVRQYHPLTAEQERLLADWQAGKSVWVGGTRHPADIIKNGSAVRPVVHLNNGRIVLQE